MNKFLILALTLIGFSAFGQSGSLDGKAVHLKLTDSTSLVTPSGYGTLFYNTQHSPPKWEIYENGVRYDLKKFGAGASSLSSLGDVNISSPTNTQLLQYFTSDNKWHNINIPTWNQNTTGSAATLTTPRNIQGVAFDGSANIDIISGTGFVKVSGTTLSYDNSTYLTGNQTITLSGDISGSGTTAITTTIGASKVTNSMLFGGIAYSKLSLTGAILNADLAGSIDATKISSGLVSNTEFDYLDGVTSALQTQLNAKQATLVSGTNIKTVNSNSLLGSGNVAVGDALVANPLSQFAATTSAQLRGVLSDELGTGAALFDGATPTSLVGTNITGTAAGLTAGNVTTNANLTGDVTSVGNATTIGSLKVATGMIQANAVTLAKLDASNATANKMLLSGASASPTWSTSTIPSSAGATANKALISDGTNYVLAGVTEPNSATTGDIPYASSANVYSNLTANSTGTNKYLQSVSSGAPSWQQIAFADLSGTSAAWLSASGATLTGANVLTGTTSNTIKFSFATLNTTQTDGAGLWLQNPTVATVSQNQISPSLVFEGNGWRTSATTASQVAKMAIDLLPVNGSTLITGQLNFKSSINGAAYSTVAYIDTNGTFSTTAAGGSQLAINFSGISSTTGFGRNSPATGLMLVLPTGQGYGIGTTIGGAIAARLDITNSAGANTFPALKIVDGTNSANSAETNRFYFGGANQGFSTATYANQRFTYFTTVGVQRQTAGQLPVFTRAANVAVQGAPIASDAFATGTNSIGLEIETANVTSQWTNSYGIIVNAMTGATNNYAAQFVGGATLFPASASGYPSLNIPEGTAPSSPTNGDHWNESTNHRLMFRQNGVSVEFLGVSAVNSVSPTAQNRTITVLINGTTYYLTAKTTND